jgi:hypothetical protein
MTERIIVGADGRYYITTEPKTNKQEWQGLTEEELENIYKRCTLFNTPKYFAMAIEQALKEKNT